MKKYLFPALLIISVILTGCTTITQTTYLQNVEITGPINPPPIKVIDGQKAGDITLSTSFSFNQTNKSNANTGTHTKVNSQGIYQIDTVKDGTSIWYAPSGNDTYDFEGKNLLWNLPEFSFTVNSAICISNHVDFSAGLNFVNQDHRSLIGGNAGFGFFTEKENSAFRLNVGILWQQLYYYATSAVITEYKPAFSSSKTEVYFYKDQDKTTSWNPYVSLTYNSTMKDFPLNFFLNLGFFGETIYDFKPTRPNEEFYPFGINFHSVDARGEGTASFFTYGGGIYLRLTDFAKFSAGVRFFNETQFDGSPNSFYALPIIQVDMNF